jgi:hypothetical protein
VSRAGAVDVRRSMRTSPYAIVEMKAEWKDVGKITYKLEFTFRSNHRGLDFYFFEISHISVLKVP